MPAGKIKDRSLYEKAYHAIKSNILKSEFLPGSRLQEEYLVNLFGISKTPIKMALSKLEQEGLVSVVHRRGTFVVDLTTEKIREIYSLREVLEGLAARLAAKNLSKSEIHELRNIVEKIECGNNENEMDLKQYIEQDERFHVIILEASNHQMLQQSIANIFDLSHMFKLKSATLPGRQKESSEEHKKILAALEKRDSQKAEAVMRAHIQKIGVAFHKHVEESYYSQLAEKNPG
jgi:DNA-binding GntR family transcriptional regulator